MQLSPWKVLVEDRDDNKVGGKWRSPRHSTPIKPRPYCRSAHSSLMMEAARTSETSVDNHFTQQYNPEDSSEQGLKQIVRTFHWKVSTEHMGTKISAFHGVQYTSLSFRLYS
jgi:hypothetical protein